MVRSFSLRVFVMLRILTLIGGFGSGSANSSSIGSPVVVGADEAKVTAESIKRRRRKKFVHLVVFVHGYLGSDREQEYLGEMVEEKGKKNSSIRSNTNHDHEFIVLYSKSNVGKSTDGVANGGKRVAKEIHDWIKQYKESFATAEEKTTGKEHDEPIIIMTLSIIGNSLGGLYSRYAIGEFYHNPRLNSYWRNGEILPLLFCSTSSPHLGVSQELFIELPKWVEPYVATVMQQQTMNDLFISNDSTIVTDMCTRVTDADDDDETGSTVDKDDDKHRDFLFPLQLFQKRIAVANAYNTDFLVSVSSAAFLSAESDSVHYHQSEEDNHSIGSSSKKNTRTATSIDDDNNGKEDDDDDTAITAACSDDSAEITDDSSACLSSDLANDDDDNTDEGTTTGNYPTRLMKNIDFVALQVTTDAATESSSSSSSSKDTNSSNDDDKRNSCVEALDKLGWHKILIDTRSVLPSWLTLTTPGFTKKAKYTSGELNEQFKRYGTLLPIAHPLNMANSKTDLYRELTKKGQPIMDALAELMLDDMIQLSERATAAT